MTTTAPSTETWADVSQRLHEEESAEYVSFQEQFDAAEEEHRRLIAAAVSGEDVEPLALERAESRKQLTVMRLQALQETQRRRRNAAAEEFRATVRARVEEVIARHAGAEDKVTAARQKVAAALTELRETVEAFNADVAAVLDDAGGAFTVAVQRDPIVDMVPVRDPVTQEVVTRPVVKRAAGPVQLMPFTEEVDGLLVTGWSVSNGMVTGGPKALVLDGTRLEPVDVDKAAVSGIEEQLPKGLQTAAKEITKYGRGYGGIQV